MQTFNLNRRCVAEALGTFWLVFGGCGSALLAASFPTAANTLGIGFLGVALAFGLTVMTMAYAIGHISGCHLNPAVTLGLCAASRFAPKDAIPYIVAQCLGAVLAGSVLTWLLTQHAGGIDLGGTNPLATNGFGAHSPGGFSMAAAFVAETVLTFAFLMIILGSTDKRAPQGFGPIAIGLGLTLIHLISIPLTNTSVNPARSLGVALFAGPELLGQLWLFWAAPLLGAITAGVVYHNAFQQEDHRIEGAHVSAGYRHT
jgi:aquaporin Z